MGLPGSSSSCADVTLAMTASAPGTSRRTRRIAAISCVTVSWVATASSTVESSARRVLPVIAPLRAMTCCTAVKIRFGSVLAASRRRQYVSVVSWNARLVTGQPIAAFHRRSTVTASVVSESDRPRNVCSTITVAITSPGTDGRHATTRTGPRTSRPGTTTRGARPKTRTRPRLQQMPRHRLRVQQLPLILPTTLHANIIPTPIRWPGTTRSYSGVS